MVRDVIIYFDKYILESNIVLLSETSRFLSERICDDVRFIAGLELGGVPIATAIAMSLNKDLLFVRKQSKEYCTCRQVEGVIQPGAKTIVIEDVVTSGGSVLKGIEALEKAGVTVTGVLAVVDRCRGGKENIENRGYSFYSIMELE